MFASRDVGGFRVHAIALYVVVVLVIILHGWFIRKYHIRDPLAKRLYYHPLCQEIDGWSITHLLFFGLLGVLFPNQYLQFLIIGVGWEVVETVLGQNEIKIAGRRLQLTGDQDEDGYPTGKQDAYWYGRSSDILVDVLGYTLGSTWAEKYWPKTPRAAAAPAPAPHRGAPPSAPPSGPRAAMFPDWL